MEGVSPIDPQTKGKISSIFLRNDGLIEDEEYEKPQLSGKYITVRGLPQGFVFLEYLPISYLSSMQYELGLVEYTEHDVQKSRMNLVQGRLFKVNDESIYLF